MHGGFWLIFLTLFEKYTFVVIAFGSLSVICVCLGVLLFLQLWNVSINMTTIENEKYKALATNPAARKSHFYDKGFVMNWREVIFPPTPRCKRA